MTTTRIEPPPAPPGTVFAASYLFAGVAALALVSAVGTFFAIPEFSHYQSDQAGDGTAGEHAAFGLTAFALLAIVFGAVCLLLAFRDGRGTNAARVLTWVVGGLSVCFNVALLAVGPDDPVPWYGSMTRIVAFGMLLLTIGSVTLLALPASHRYFRVTSLARQRPRSAPTPPPPPPGYLPPPPGYPAPPLNYPAPPPGYPAPPLEYPTPPTGYPVPPPGYPSPPPPLPSTRRPVAVTTAMAVLLCLAITAVAGAVVEILTYRAIVEWLDNYERTVQQQTAQLGINVAFPHLPGAAVGPTVIVVGALVAVAAALGGLALAIRLPRPRARISALVVAGLVALLAAARAILTMTTQATMDQIAAQSRQLEASMSGGQYRDLFPSITDIYPQWSYYAVYLSSALAIVGCIAVFVLLTVRSSAAWFATAGCRTHWPTTPPPPNLWYPHQPTPVPPAPGNDHPGTDTTAH